MALSYDQISAITTKKIMPKMVDNIFDSNPLLARARKKFYEKADGGLSIMQPLNYAQSAAGTWYSGADTLNLTDSDIGTAAEYSWKQIYEPITISRLDELKNSGDSAKLKLVAQKAKVVEKSLEDKLGIGLFSNATDAKSIIGLRQIVGTSNTVGGISQTTYTWWAAQLDTTSTTLTIAGMQSRDQACTIGSDSPSVIVTTRALYNAYYALLQPQQRFTDSESAKGGFSSVMFNGKPVVVDSHCPASHMFFLNEDYLHLYYHPDENFRNEPFQKPINQNVRVSKIFWAGAFGSSNNRMHGLMNALTG